MRLPVQLLIFALLTAAWFYLLLGDSTPIPRAEWEWADLVFESLRVGFDLALLIVVYHFREKTLPVQLLIAGFFLTLIGSMHDFAEELFALPLVVSLLFENLPYSAGIICIAVGIYKLAENHNRLVSRLEEEKTVLHQRGNIDALTGVYNRTFFQEYSVQMMQLNRRAIDTGKKVISVAIIDLDNFKSINDNYGHDTGDLVLKKMAALARTRITPAEHIVRLGGEEFLIIHEGPEDELAAMTRKLLEEFSKLRISNEEVAELYCSFSAGVTAVRPQESLRDAMKRADSNLYRAKEEGRKRVYGDIADVVQAVPA